MLRTFAYASLLTIAAMPAAALAQDSGSAFVTQQGQDQWRVSKLIGVRIMGADQASIGRIDEVLLDHNGNAQAVIIGVGGFLGFGGKEVAVPFKALQWRTDSRQVLIDDRTAPSQPGALGQTGGTKVADTDPAATEANQGYPDMGVLSMSRADLLAAPDFRYAQRPETTEAGMGGEVPNPRN
jgi:sporulation protein YlmC with PRC-barrel domain